MFDGGFSEEIKNLGLGLESYARSSIVVDLIGKLIVNCGRIISQISLLAQTNETMPALK